MFWHFCQAQNAEKLELLNKRFLRFIFKDWNCDFDSSLEQAGALSLANTLKSYFSLERLTTA